MTSRIPTGVGLLLVAGLTAFHLESARAQASPTAPIPVTIDGVPDTGQFLPDDAILARVEGRVIRAGDFVDRYFNSLVQFRPASDSLGRVEFLNSMINKEVLALTALEANRPLDFEDRAVLREHEEQVLSTLLYRRTVMDSISYSDDAMQRVYDEYQSSLRFRHILVEDHESAARIRDELVAGRIRWEDAVTKYSLDRNSEAPDGEIGWKGRIGMDAIIAEALFSLKPGEISQPVEDGEGVHLMQCLERRTVVAPSLASLSSQIKDDIWRRRGGEISRRFMTRMARDIGMTYDSTLIRQVARRFALPSQRFSAGVLTVDPNLPAFSRDENSRVLARYQDGELTLGELVSKYEEITPIARPPLNTFNAVVSQIHAITLEPARNALARRMGLDQDPLFQAAMDKRTEQLRVEHLFQDSVVSKIRVDPRESREYYGSHIAQYMEYPTVRYARFHLERQSLADSIVQRLEAGEDAEQLIHADFVQGHTVAEISERRHNEPGAETKFLFEELRPGEVRMMGPDGHGHATVYKVLSLDPGRQLSFEEAESMAEETVRNMKSESALQALIERHRKRYRIESFPEKVMLIRLVDPMT